MQHIGEDAELDTLRELVAAGCLHPPKTSGVDVDVGKKVWISCHSGDMVENA